MKVYLSLDSLRAVGMVLFFHMPNLLLRSEKNRTVPNLFEY
jgi:hypothetical protein